MVSNTRDFRLKSLHGIIAIPLAAVLASCGSYASFNKPLDPSVSGPAISETAVSGIAPGAGPEGSPSTPSESNRRELCGFEYPDFGPHLVGLTLSGGGARAAVFSSAVMFELADLGLLNQIDVISSASGGSLAAAFYAVTCDATDDDTQCQRALDPSREVSRRKWDRSEVYDRLSRDFIIRSVGSRLLPNNLLLTMFTAYDNTDILAQVLSDNLYDSPFIGTDFSFADINPTRPFLVVNATNATGNPYNSTALAEYQQRRSFTFTKWTFDQLGSDICSFEIGRTIAASSAYPAVFNYSTLTNFTKEKQYVHLSDAGASDNLAIAGLKDTLNRLEIYGPSYRNWSGSVNKITIFVVDAQNGFALRPGELNDVRSLLDRIVDRNFIDFYDTLMMSGYSYTLDDLDANLTRRGFAVGRDRNVFHLALKGLAPGWRGYEGAQETFHANARFDAATEEERRELLKAVNGIETSYGLEEREVHCLAASAHVLVNDLRPKLEEIFGELPQVEAETFRKDVDDCLSKDKGRAGAVIR